MKDLGSRTITVLFALGLGASGPAIGQAGEIRTWTDQSGQHSVEAEFIRVEDDQVVLRRGDGKQISVPIAQLAEQDQQTVQTLNQVRVERLQIEQTSLQFLQLLRQANRDEAQDLITARSREVFEGQQSPIKTIPNVDRGTRSRIRDVSVTDEVAIVETSLAYKGKQYPAKLHLRNEDGKWLVFAATGQDADGQTIHLDFENQSGSNVAGATPPATQVAVGEQAAAADPVALPVSTGRLSPLPLPGNAASQQGGGDH